MTSLALLIPVAIGLGLLGLGTFFWTMKSHQYDDLDGAAMRILIDEDDEPVGTPAADAPVDENRGTSPWR